MRRKPAACPAPSRPRGCGPSKVAAAPCPPGGPAAPRVPLGPSHWLGVTLPNAFSQVRTRGSIKRRPPSRRFRRSQSDCGELGDFRAAASPQENGAREEDGDEVFPPKGQGAAGKEGRRSPGPREERPLRRTASWTEKPEEKGPAPEGATPGGRGEASEPPAAPGSEAEDGSPSVETPAAEQVEEPTKVEEDGVKSQDEKLPEEGAVPQGTPRSPPEGAEGKGQEKQEEGAAPEPGHSPRTGQAQPETSSEVPETEVGGPACLPGDRGGQGQGQALCHVPDDPITGPGTRQAVTDGEGAGDRQGSLCPALLGLPLARRSGALVGVSGASWTGHCPVTQVLLPVTPAAPVPPLEWREHQPPSSSSRSVRPLVPEAEDRPLLPDTTPRAGLRPPAPRARGSRACASLRFNRGHRAARPAPASCKHAGSLRPSRQTPASHTLPRPLSPPLCSPC